MLQENKDSFATREVQIFPYDPQWKVEFEKIKGMITRYAGEYFSAIEHVGSTSVEGLGAKPIIDLDAVLRCPNDLPKVIEALSQHGYVHQGDLGLPGREAFFRPRDYNDEEKGVMRYHLYVCLPMLNPIGSILPSATTCAATRIPGRNISSLKYSWHSSTALMWTPTASIKPNLSGRFSVDADIKKREARGLLFFIIHKTPAYPPDGCRQVGGWENHIRSSSRCRYTADDERW